MPKMVNFASFWKREACGQTVLPDKSISSGWKVWIFTPKLFCSLHMIFCYAVAHAKNQLDFWHTKSRKQIRCVVENKKKMHELLN